MTETTVEQWAKRAAIAAVDKKADDPVVLFVGDVLAITDYFVIVSGANSRQVRTIAEAVEEELTRDGGPKPLRIEGLDDLTWVLIDYGDLVVHVFLDETRRYYELERLWSDVPRLAWADPVATRARLLAGCRLRLGLLAGEPAALEQRGGHLLRGLGHRVVRRSAAARRGGRRGCGLVGRDILERRRHHARLPVRVEPLDDLFEAVGLEALLHVDRDHVHVDVDAIDFAGVQQPASELVSRAMPSDLREQRRSARDPCR